MRTATAAPPMIRRFRLDPRDERRRLREGWRPSALSYPISLTSGELSERRTVTSAYRHAAIADHAALGTVHARQRVFVPIREPTAKVMAAASPPRMSCRSPPYHHERAVTRDTSAPAVNSP